jgi:hypothetical protein
MIQDTKLEVLKSIVQKKLSEQEQKTRESFMPIFDIVRKFIIEHKLVLYGGMALNELLPPKQKFYPKDILPDYDVFSPNAKKSGKELANVFKKAGYEYVEVSEGRHYGTFRVEVNFKIVCDITNISKRFYNYLVKSSENNPKHYQSDMKLKVAPVEFLKWSLHKELSSPQSSLDRWEKLYERYLVFHKVYKYKGTNVGKIWCEDYMEASNPHEIYTVKSMFKFVKEKQYPIVGTFALGLLTDNVKTCCKKYFSSYFDILTDDLDKTIDELKRNLVTDEKSKLIFRTRTRYTIPDIIPERIKVSLKIDGEKDEVYLCGVFKTDGCYSVIRKNGYLVGTFDTLLRYRYGFYIWSLLYTNDQRSRPDDVKKSIIALERHISKNPGQFIDERFSTECYGSEKTKINVLKAKWDEETFVYRP